MTELGRWIEKRFEGTDRTRDALAKAMGIDMGTLNQIIDGSIKRPPDARLSAMASFFGVSVETIRGLISETRLDDGADVRSGDESPNARKRLARSRCARDLFACAIGGTGTHEILLVPDGKVDTFNGDPFFLDASGARSAIELFAELDRDLVIDFEHHSIGGKHASPDGIVRAAGWISELVYRPGVGLLGIVAWTQRATEMIRAREVRYLSPVVILDEETRRVVELDSAALTNTPAISGGLPVAAKKHHKELRAMADEPAMGTVIDPTIAISRIAEVLGIEDSEDMAALTAAILTEVRALKSSAGDSDETPSEDTEVAANTRKALGLATTAKASEVLVALKSIKQGATGDDSLRAEVGRLRTEVAGRNAKDLMEPYIKSGRINPRDEEDMAVCRKLAMEDAAMFAHHMDRRKPFVEPGMTEAPNPNGRDVGDGAKEEEKMIEESLKLHNRNHKEAFASLQSELMQPMIKRGFTRKAAGAACRKQYPKIFG